MRPGYSHTELMRDRYVVLAPPGSRFDGRDDVLVSELEGEELITNGDRTSCMRNVNEAWRAAGYEPSIVFSTDDNLTLQRLVGHRARARDRPRARGRARGGVELRRHLRAAPTGEIAPRRIGLFWPAGRSRSTAACAFVDIATEVCAGDFALST